MAMVIITRAMARAISMVTWVGQGRRTRSYNNSHKIPPTITSWIRHCNMQRCMGFARVFFHTWIIRAHVYRHTVFNSVHHPWQTSIYIKLMRQLYPWIILCQYGENLAGVSVSRTCSRGRDIAVLHTVLCFNSGPPNITILPITCPEPALMYIISGFQ